MRIQLGVPEELDDDEREEALNAALEAVTVSNEGLFKRGKAPRITTLIKSGKVKWKPEPEGQDEHFDLATTVAKRGHGDCDDLAPAYAGQLRAEGTDPDAHAFVRRSGPNRWHALVRRGDGTIEDPSLAAGMGKHGVSGVNGVAGEDVISIVGAITKSMSSDERMCLAICPHQTDPKQPRIWLARLDVPSESEPFAWSSQASHPDASQALRQAIKGARIVGEGDIDGEHDARLACVHDILNGADPHEVAEALEETAGDFDPMRVMVDGMCVGSFFSHLAHGLSHIAKPFANIASKALQFVPGVGPIASTALDMATKLLPPNHPAHPANAGQPGHAEAVHALIAQGHPAYAGVQPMTTPGAPAPAPPITPAPPGQNAQAWLWGKPRWAFQPGTAFHPFGVSGPAVMRF